MVKIKDIHFCVKNLKMKRKKNKIFLTFRSGDLNPRFSVIFPPMIWIFMESEEPEIKSKQASKKDRTLIILSYWAHHIIWKCKWLVKTSIHYLSLWLNRYISNFYESVLTVIFSYSFLSLWIRKNEENKLHNWIHPVVGILTQE